MPCPCCGGHFKVIGSRIRKYIDEASEKIKLNIRRLRCRICERIHHELPDFLAPYKRYENSCIEAVVSGSPNISVPVDESTIFRWRQWFRYLINYIIGCLEAILARTDHEYSRNKASLPTNSVEKICRYVGDADGWLARVVRTLTNSNLWVHTRSAFLS